MTNQFVQSSKKKRMKFMTHSFFPSLEPEIKVFFPSRLSATSYNEFIHSLLLHLDQPPPPPVQSWCTHNNGKFRVFFSLNRNVIIPLNAKAIKVKFYFCPKFCFFTFSYLALLSCIFYVSLALYSSVFILCLFFQKE